MAQRISASFILLLSVLFMPWWISVILALVGIIYFHYFWEAVALAIVSDLLFGVPETKFYNMVFISFLFTIIALLLIEFIKKKTRFNN